MSLYLTYRPDTLEAVKGNTETLKALAGMLANKETCPHVFLLYGETGTGKTTLARIIASELGCSENDYKEINTADFRGIDSVREIISNAQFAPMEGSVRVWVVDECFAKDTLISLHDGSQKNIQDIKIGDNVLNLVGSGKVINTFNNIIPLNRVINIIFSNNTSIICSEDHLFMTPSGWIKAKNLKNNLVYNKINRNFMPDNNSLITDINGKIKTLLPKMPQAFDKKTKKILFFNLLKSSKSKASSSRNSDLYNLWKRILSQMVLFPCYLWAKMWKYISWTTSYWNDSIRSIQTKIIKLPIIFFSNRGGSKESRNAFQTYVNKQSSISRDKFNQSKRDEEDKWNPSCLARSERGEREFYSSSNSFSNSIGLENGNGNTNRTQSNRWFWLSNLLQIRYWKSFIKNSNRGGWESSQYEKSQVIRLKEGKQIEELRVENITFYKSGNNREYFSSIITDKERNQGFVELYDLEIEDHPSYIANNILVHNCQQFTKDAQNALLKILEDTPKHVYFILCTTDPQKLLSTIRGRCQQLQTKPLNEQQMFSLLRQVVRKEGEDIDKQIYDQIIETAQGHPRNALQILEQVLKVPAEERLEISKRQIDNQAEIIELCRVLLNGSKWSVVKEIITKLKDQEPESIRRVVLGYCQAVLLKSENNQAAFIMENFWEPTYDIGFPYITYACYSIINSK